MDFISVFGLSAKKIPICVNWNVVKSFLSAGLVICMYETAVCGMNCLMNSSDYLFTTS